MAGLTVADNMQGSRKRGGGSAPEGVSIIYEYNCYYQALPESMPCTEILCGLCLDTDDGMKWLDCGTE